MTVDNKLDSDEFAIAMHLTMRIKNSKCEVPEQLPSCLHPTSPMFPNIKHTEEVLTATELPSQLPDIEDVSESSETDDQDVSKVEESAQISAEEKLRIAQVAAARKQRKMARRERRRKHRLQLLERQNRLRVRCCLLFWWLLFVHGAFLFPQQEVGVVPLHKPQPLGEVMVHTYDLARLEDQISRHHNRTIEWLDDTQQYILTVPEGEQRKEEIRLMLEEKGEVGG